MLHIIQTYSSKCIKCIICCRPFSPLPFLRPLLLNQKLKHPLMLTMATMATVLDIEATVMDIDTAMEDTAMVVTATHTTDTDTVPTVERDPLMPIQL